MLKLKNKYKWEGRSEPCGGKYEKQGNSQYAGYKSHKQQAFGI